VKLVYNVVKLVYNVVKLVYNTPCHNTAGRQLASV